MRRYLLRISLATATFLFGLTLAKAGHQVRALIACQHSNVDSGASQAESQPRSTSKRPEGQVWIGDILTDQDKLTYEGYTLERLSKMVRIDDPTEAGSRRMSTVPASYARLTRHGRAVATFDARVYFPQGNQMSFGLFPLLGGSKKQLIVSQDIPRGGSQWIASLSPRFHIIFDGKWGAGREGDNMQIVDLDHDGVYEIIMPITDFYDLQDKMSVSQIPLPTIVFKYDKIADRYVPANPLFAEKTVAGDGTESEAAQSSDEFAQRSSILALLLDKVYEGKEVEGWSFFDHAYTVSDKEEVRKRVKSILKDEPVYKFIYKHTHER